MSEKISDGYVPVVAEIAKIEELTSWEKRFTFKLPKKIIYKPCQFVMVSIPGFGEAPISITSGPDDPALQLTVRNVGSLTNKIHSLKKGDVIGIRGPFGNGFPVEILEGQDILLVCGGLGLAPLNSLIRYILANRKKFGDFNLLYGCKHPNERLYVKEMEDWKKSKDVEFHETVDIGESGWEGNVGLITSLFPKINPKPYGCVASIVGPPIMYKFVIRELMKKNFNFKQIYVSLERRMRCGLGKCGHCQMNEMYVCQDGPIFCYNDILTDSVKEAL